MNAASGFALIGIVNVAMCLIAVAFPCERPARDKFWMLRAFSLTLLFYLALFLIGAYGPVIQ